MSALENAALVRTMVSAFMTGDLETVVASFAPDAVWELPGRGRLAGEYKGPEAIVGFLASSFELSGGTLSLELMDVLSSDTGAAHLQHITADYEGRHLECVEVLVHEIVDGRIVRTYHRPDPYAIDAFFG